MIKKKKVLVAEDVPGFHESIADMPAESKIFVDKSMEIAHFIVQLMQQRGMKQKELAEKMGKTEAEVSKWLAGMHNFTLRSLAKIEAALGAAIIFVPKQPVIAAPPITSRTTVSGVKDVVEKTEPKIRYAKVVHMNLPPQQQNQAI